MKKDGFTLLEVLLSLIILVSAVSIFSSTQVRSMLRVLKAREQVDRMFYIKNLVMDAFLSLPKKENQKVRFIQNPDLKFNSQIININKKSSLNSFSKRINIIRSYGEWKNITGSRSLEFVGFVLKPFNFQSRSSE